VNGATLSISLLVSSFELFELVGGEQMRLVDCDDDGTAAFVFLGGEVVHGLGDQGRGVEAGDPAEAADQGGVEAAGADGRVG
jgi:hypothetical protein